MLTRPSNVLPLHLKQTFLPIVFKEGEGDGIESRLSFKIFSTLKKAQVLELKGFTTDEQNTESESDDEEQEPGRLKRSEVIDFQVQLKSKSSEESSSADETSDSGAEYLVFSPLVPSN